MSARAAAQEQYENLSCRI